MITRKSLLSYRGLDNRNGGYWWVVVQAGSFTSEHDLWRGAQFQGGKKENARIAVGIGDKDNEGLKKQGRSWGEGVPELFSE